MPSKNENISSLFQAGYFEVGQLSFEANSSAIERKRWAARREKNRIKSGSYAFIVAYIRKNLKTNRLNPKKPASWPPPVFP